MSIPIFELRHDQYLELLNNAKDDVIEKINRDHGLNINPAEYLYVVQLRGSLGRIWDKFIGKIDEGTGRRILVRVHIDPSGKKDVEASKKGVETQPTTHP